MVISAKCDIFECSADVLVNPVNVVGVMGAGLAKQFRERFPDMYDDYRSRCASGDFRIGLPYLFESENNRILNFPTKRDWRDKSNEGIIRVGLENFLFYYKAWGVESIAFPLLGAGLGGLSKTTSIMLLHEYLSQADDLVSYIVSPLE